jgi:hypothetical protein
MLVPDRYEYRSDVPEVYRELKSAIGTRLVAPWLASRKLGALCSDTTRLPGATRSGLSTKSTRLGPRPE